MTRLARIRGWNVYHKAHRRPYHEENSLRGIVRAARAGYEGIDLDVSIDAGNAWWFNHWPKLILHDGFHDPKNQVHAQIPIEHMSTVQVGRLRGPNGYKVLSVTRGLAACKKHGLTACMEAKGDRRLTEEWRWDWLRALCDRMKVDPIVMALPRNRGALKAAHAAGFRTMWLWRGPVPREAYQYLTYVKRGGRVYRVTGA